MVQLAKPPVLVSPQSKQLSGHNLWWPVAGAGVQALATTGAGVGVGWGSRS